MKTFTFAAALIVCAVALVSLSPAQDMSKKILPTMKLDVKPAVERTPEEMDAFDATAALPAGREVPFRPTMNAAEYAQLKRAAELAPHTARPSNPSIAADPAGHFGITWSVTDPPAGLLPSEYFADNNGSLTPLNVFTSASCYNTSGVARWGDYSQTSVDPGSGPVANINTRIFWIDNETVPSSNFWSTEIANIKY